ncbi:ABC transporter substrate-binding protein [Vibrio rhizosphaerae]|uniref:ABC transporter substrate-binding protein n=1 Tax=Vibrio rhizosphaerae TaxID=398736 RepID=A0ABU4IRB9_9VIBR|nr:ABC transporter substrate-binding protein [Vibrio rhizosphaerae]MDW6091478.1 ABC transporter substrate-binding protein [Vibrio rhizosphaerae]
MLKRFMTLLLILFVPQVVAKVTTVTDVLGRQVTLALPAQRVVLGFYGEDYMAIGTEKAFDHVVGMSKGIWEQWRPANWAMYVAHRPSLETLPDVGKVDTQTFSVEKVMSLHPDLLVLAEWQYKGLGSDVDRIEQAGIPVIVVDYNAQTVERHVESTLIIGQITGQEARAQKIATEYQNMIQVVKDRLAKANLPKPTIYAEFGFPGTKEYGYTFGKNMWGAMSEVAGGDNISKPFVEWWGHLNPEQVLAAQPDVILITGYEFGGADDSMLIGQNIDRATALARLKGYKHRLGWSSLPAVKNNRMIGIYHGASRSIMDAPMTQFIAKALYPDLFADLDPEAEYLNFYKKYLPVTPTGTFAVSL